MFETSARKVVVVVGYGLPLNAQLLQIPLILSLYIHLNISPLYIYISLPLVHLKAPYYDLHVVLKGHQYVVALSAALILKYSG